VGFPPKYVIDAFHEEGLSRVYPEVLILLFLPASLFYVTSTEVLLQVLKVHGCHGGDQPIAFRHPALEVSIHFSLIL